MNFIRLLYAFFLLLLLFAFISSCRDKNDAPQSDTGPETSGPDSINTLHIQPKEFIEVDSGILMFPLEMSREYNRKKNYYKETPASTSWNMLFYNSNTNKQHLLSDSKILIDNYFLSDVNSYTGSQAFFPGYIFYTARIDDHNKDELLTDDDPLYLFVSDKSGFNFQQVSPAGFDLYEWRYIATSKKIILSVIDDKDRDNKFESHEEILIFEKKIEGNSPPSQVFSKLFLDSLKINYGKQWPVIRR